MLACCVCIITIIICVDTFSNPFNLCSTEHAADADDGWTVDGGWWCSADPRLLRYMTIWQEREQFNILWTFRQIVHNNGFDEEDDGDGDEYIWNAALRRRRRRPLTCSCNKTQTTASQDVMHLLNWNDLSPPLIISIWLELGFRVLTNQSMDVVYYGWYS